MWRELIGEGDANDDGEITFEEFKTMMKKMLHKKEHGNGSASS